MSRSPEVGSPAPEFSLPGTVRGDGAFSRGEYTLAGHRGQALVLAFYPGDDTPTCTKQLCSYSAGLDRFAELGAVVWGISRQDLDSHEAFAAKRDINFPLLSDVDGAVVAKYGIGMPGLGLRRSVFVIGPDGTVRWRHIALVGLTYQDLDTLAEQLAALR